MTLAAAFEGFLCENVKVLPATAGLWQATLQDAESRRDLFLPMRDRLCGKDDPPNRHRADLEAHARTLTNQSRALLTC